MLLIAAALAVVPAGPVPVAPDRPVCVPLRDSWGKATGGQACRTAAQWRKILVENGREANPVPGLLNGQVFANPRP